LVFDLLEQVHHRFRYGLGIGNVLEGELPLLASRLDGDVAELEDVP